MSLKSKQEEKEDQLDDSITYMHHADADFDFELRTILKTLLYRIRKLEDKLSIAKP